MTVKRETRSCTRRQLRASSVWRRSTGTSRRRRSRSEGRRWTLSAPGEDIIPACPGGTQICKSHGTSDATALASASAALIWSKYPKWTNNQVLRVMINTAGKPKSGQSPYRLHRLWSRTSPHCPEDPRRPRPRRRVPPPGPRGRRPQVALPGRLQGHGRAPRPTRSSPTPRRPRPRTTATPASGSPSASARPSSSAPQSPSRSSAPVAAPRPMARRSARTVPESAAVPRPTARLRAVLPTPTLRTAAIRGPASLGDLPVSTEPGRSCGRGLGWYGRGLFVLRDAPSQLRTAVPPRIAFPRATAVTDEHDETGDGRGERDAAAKPAAPD